MFALNEKYLPHYTRADYEQWEGNWELIGGIPYSMVPDPGIHQVMEPAPDWYHQKLNGRIFATIESALIGCDTCEANMPINWQIAEDTIVQPDIVVVSKPFNEGVYLTKTPEMIFEILSPSTASKDRTLKYELYRDAGVKYYIIVHPIEKSLEIFLLDKQNYRSLGSFSSGSYKFEITECSFDFQIEKIW